MMLLSLSTCPWKDSSLSRTRIPLLRLRSADPLCVARNADRSLPSTIRDVRPQNGLRNKTQKASARRACCRLSGAPKGPQTYEIVAGARRYRAAQLAAIGYVPVRIADLSDAQALETSIVENLQRRDVHPLEEAQGFAALMRLEEPAYSIEQIAAKCGKQPGYVASRIRLTELAPAVVEAFAKDEIGVGHALLLAKLQPEQQQEALAACWQESYGNGNKSKRILLPVRHLREWIEHNILLELAAAPFSKDDPQLVPEAGSCLDCPKRTGHNTLLFEGSERSMTVAPIRNAMPSSWRCT